jgi:hypothetical protein
MTKIYLDACCLSCLTDDQAQHRIREEAEAVELILRRMHSGEVQWISSEVLTDEINRNPNLERRLGNAALLRLRAAGAMETFRPPRPRKCSTRARRFRSSSFG